MPSLSPPEEPPAPVAIVLLQLGGPSSLDEVQPFLENMFRDPELFNLPIPAWVQDWLAGRVSKWRAKQARPLYASIGGRSPIGEITARQADLLERELNRSLCSRAGYGKPSTEAAEAVLAANCHTASPLPAVFHRYDRELCAGMPRGNNSTYPLQRDSTRRTPRTSPRASPCSVHMASTELVRQGDPCRGESYQRQQTALAERHTASPRDPQYSIRHFELRPA